MIFLLNRASHKHNTSLKKNLGCYNFNWGNDFSARVEIGMRLCTHYWLDRGSVRLIILSARAVRLSYWVSCHIECSFGYPYPSTIESLISCL